MLATRLPPFAEARLSVGRAVRWALVLHAGQRRDVDHAPFVVHPLEVAALLSAHGFDDDIVAAGVLHDLVEKSDASVADVERRFGARVARLVAAVTEDASIVTYEARKAALREQVAGAGEGACAVYAADKVAKAREMRAARTVDEAKLAHYAASLEMLRAAAPGLALVEQLDFELWALGAFTT